MGVSDPPAYHIPGLVVMHAYACGTNLAVASKSATCISYAFGATSLQRDIPVSLYGKNGVLRPLLSGLEKSKDDKRVTKSHYIV
jgi:hypothetical protein